MSGPSSSTDSSVSGSAVASFVGDSSAVDVATSSPPPAGGEGRSYLSRRASRYTATTPPPRPTANTSSHGIAPCGFPGGVEPGSAWPVNSAARVSAVNSAGPVHWRVDRLSRTLGATLESITPYPGGARMTSVSPRSRPGSQVSPSGPATSTSSTWRRSPLGRPKFVHVNSTARRPVPFSISDSGDVRRSTVVIDMFRPVERLACSLARRNADSPRSDVSPRSKDCASDRNASRSASVERAKLADTVHVASPSGCRSATIVTFVLPPGPSVCATGLSSPAAAWPAAPKPRRATSRVASRAPRAPRDIPASAIAGGKTLSIPG